MELNNGQTWIFYTTEETTFIIGSNTDGGLGTLTASGPATGYIRFGGGKPFFAKWNVSILKTLSQDGPDHSRIR